MPSALTYPGVYVEEIPSGVRTITGVATSITAFLGRALRGPVNEPVTINSYGDFERQFGGLDVNCPLGYAVRDFFGNGGAQAIIVRLEKNSARSKQMDVKLEAATPGTWADAMVFTVDKKGITADVATRFGVAEADLFNLTLYENPGGGAVERFLNVSVLATAGSRRLDRVLADESSLARVQVKADSSPDLPAARPADSVPAEDPSDPAADKTKFKKFTGGKDSEALGTDAEVLGNEATQTGMYALAKADLFNLLCIPPDKREDDTLPAVYRKAKDYCAKRRAMLIVDAPAKWGAIRDKAASEARDGLPGLGLNGVESRNAAI